LEKFNLKEYDSLFEKYNDFIIKNNNKYLSFGNKIDINLLEKYEIDVLRKKYSMNLFIIDDELSIIFDKYLLKLLSANNIYDKYYFKTNDRYINPLNVVDSDALVFILKIKVDYNIDFGVFLKNDAMLKNDCKIIEKEIQEKYNIKLKIVFDLII